MTGVLRARRRAGETAHAGMGRVHEAGGGGGKRRRLDDGAGDDSVAALEAAALARLARRGPS